MSEYAAHLAMTQNMVGWQPLDKAIPFVPVRAMDHAGNVATAILQPGGWAVHDPHNGLTHGQPFRAVKWQDLFSS